MSDTKTTQIQMVYHHLKNRGPITPLEAIHRYKILRLGARIFNLRALGFDISSEIVRLNGKAFAKYTLIAEPNELPKCLHS